MILGAFFGWMSGKGRSSASGSGMTSAHGCSMGVKTLTPWSRCQSLTLKGVLSSLAVDLTRFWATSQLWMLGGSISKEDRKRPLSLELQMMISGRWTPGPSQLSCKNHGQNYSKLIMAAGPPESVQATTSMPRAPRAPLTP